MIWPDFLDRIKLYSVRVTYDGQFIVLEGVVDGERRHVTVHVEDQKGPIDTQDVTSILLRFRIPEMFFHD